MKCQQNLVNFTICTAQQFESRVGRLTAHAQIDVPPYVEIVIQPGKKMAFRHSEYMLVRDVGVLLDLYFDSETLLESINWSDPPEWSGAASENNYSLGRSVVQSCFNLLESFVSGLARAHVMTAPRLDKIVQRKFLSTREPIKERVRLISRIIVGQDSPLDANKYPLEPLFGEVKRSRDAFVHCEPGPMESERGYVKEAVFHDMSPSLVNLAVKCTHETIRST